MAIKIKDKAFVPFINENQLKQKISQVGAQITQDYLGKDVVLLGVLNGSFMFMADLCRSIDLSVSCTFVKISSYQGTKSSEKVTALLGIQENLENKNVIIVEDIIDTGISMDHMLKQIYDFKPASVSLVALLFKPEAFRFNYQIDYVCFEIPNKFVVGYGLDYDGLGRNLKEIYQLDTP
ncbi:hypoxanthine phosphoribosyltransferase [Algoriphagus halophilus]|uniref:Hypoxanthine phosphoribosyltransferase n=1 Tax=Algoriphagus halophilus TaxID=226505 RepID=A0A1N6FGY0_9BACT|nr:hypoxanthine phosphoribosyltransferase [Algoriphagus halophilus]SIN94519.1 hypoxanthine phosphoribosyltransferase [Algoriphagus halophilus]